MSWDGWLQSMLSPVDGGKILVAEAAICCHEPGQESVWASTSGFNISVDEIKRVVKAGPELFTNGPHVSGEKCRLIRDLLDESEHCMDLKTNCDKQGHSFVICVGKTVKTLVFAKGVEGAHAGQINIKVNYVVTKLREIGY